MTRIIKPERGRRQHDPQIAPVPGTRGSCGLCGTYGDLSETHILPQAVGNNKAFLAEGFLTSLSEQSGQPLKRRFPNGVHFRTLCRECNSALGGSEDKELTDLYRNVRSFTRSSLRALPELAYLETRPNLLIRGVLAHLLSANDQGVPGRFDQEVQAIFKGTMALRESTLRVYYWRYEGQWLTIARDISVSERFGSRQAPDWLQVLKLKPLGFAVTDKPEFRSLPCLNDYLTAHASLITRIPFRLAAPDHHPHWPATTGQSGIMLAGSNTAGLVAQPLWRRH